MKRESPQKDKIKKKVKIEDSESQATRLEELYQQIGSHGRKSFRSQRQGRSNGSLPKKMLSSKLLRNRMHMMQNTIKRLNIQIMVSQEGEEA